MRIKGLWRVQDFLRKSFLLFRSKAIVLAYHRVISLKQDAQLLSVSPENFELHLKFLSNNYFPLSLHDLIEGLRRGNIPNKSVILTFDDGYLDNLIYAKPLLEKYNFPATVFVSSGYIDKDEEFWWDELERIILLSQSIPNKLSLKIGDNVYEWNIIQGEEYENWNVAKKYLPNSKFSLYLDLHKLLRPIKKENRDNILNDLRKQLKIEKKSRPCYRVVSSIELNNLCSDGLIEIGSHTVTHPVLSDQDENIQNFEIFRSKKDIEKHLQKKVQTFSYPFGGKGDIGNGTVSFVKDSGYKGAVANFFGIVTKKTDPFLLPRCLVRNWKEDIFAQHLKRWFKGG